MNEATIRFPDTVIDAAIDAINDNPEISNASLARLVSDDLGLQDVVGDALRDVALQAMR